MKAMNENNGTNVVIKTDEAYPDFYFLDVTELAIPKENMEAIRRKSFNESDLNERIVSAILYGIVVFSK